MTATHDVTTKLLVKQDQLAVIFTIVIHIKLNEFGLLIILIGQFST